MWFGRKTPDQKAFIWISAEEFLGQAAANDEVYGNTKQGNGGREASPPVPPKESGAFSEPVI